MKKKTGSLGTRLLSVNMGYDSNIVCDVKVGQVDKTHF